MFKRILNWIWPEFCIICGGLGKLWCLPCQTKIKPVKTCQLKQPTEDLDGLWFMCRHHDQVMQIAIHVLKYNRAKVIGIILGDILSEWLQENVSNYHDYVYTALPLHPKRQAQRGFNQSDIIIKQVAKNLGLNYIGDLLIRAKYKRPQVGLNQKQRQINIANAFIVNPKYHEMDFDKICIFDDVFTTGSTLNEAAKVLKQVSVNEVWGLVLAKR